MALGNAEGLTAEICLLLVPAVSSAASLGLVLILE